ncbi:MAG: hypothetical protein JWP74_2436 [Marmoricola sp.]|nr:hypothetical protein [Marmoricola sp.]
MSYNAKDMTCMILAEPGSTVRMHHSDGCSSVDQTFDLVLWAGSAQYEFRMYFVPLGGGSPALLDELCSKCSDQCSVHVRKGPAQ